MEPNMPKEFEEKREEKQTDKDPNQLDLLEYLDKLKKATRKTC